jgi:magnesium transporter
MAARQGDVSAPPHVARRATPAGTTHGGGADAGSVATGEGSMEAPVCHLLRSAYRAPDGTVRTGLSIDEVAALLAPGAPCDPRGPGANPAGAPALWVDIDARDPMRESMLREVFRFHPLAIEDTGNPNSRVKAEEYDGYLFVIVRGVRFCEETPDPYDIETLNICGFVGPSYVVTVHGEGAAAVDGLLVAPGRAGELLARGPARVLHAVVDAAVDAFFPVLDAVDAFSDTFEERVFVDFDESVLREVFAVKRLVLALKRHLGPQRDVMAVLANRPLALLPGSSQLYFRDVYDHVLRLNDSLDTYRDLLSSTLDSYLSQVSNRLGRSSKALSTVATVTLPFVIVSGMWGMNFARVPWSDVPHGFWLLVAGQCMLAAALVAALKWLRLL